LNMPEASRSSSVPFHFLSWMKPGGRAMVSSDQTVGVGTG
jgi:hypothetical protein